MYRPAYLPTISSWAASEYCRHTARSTNGPEERWKKRYVLTSKVSLCSQLRAELTHLTHGHAARKTDQSARGKRKRDQALPEQEEIPAGSQKGNNVQGVSAGKPDDCVACRLSTHVKDALSLRLEQLRSVQVELLARGLELAGLRLERMELVSTLILCKAPWTFNSR